jgi:hypothetical protein
MRALLRQLFTPLGFVLEAISGVDGVNGTTRKRLK